jgi:serine/threonine protein kinase
MPFLPGYRVHKYLGDGAFDEVWLTPDLNLPRVVVLKTLKVRTARSE